MPMCCPALRCVSDRIVCVSNKSNIIPNGARPKKNIVWTSFVLHGLCTRVLLTDRSGQTGAVRYRYTGPVWPETGRYRWNSNFAVHPVRTGIPVGLAGIPVGLTGNRSNLIFFHFLVQI